MDKDGWRDGGTDSTASSKSDLPAGKRGFEEDELFLECEWEEAEDGGSSELE